MNFRIADTFTASLAKLTGNEQKAVKTTAFDLQLNPAHPGMRFHKLNAARDPNFCSLRVNRDIRLIVHRSADNLLLCYVDHHDRAYRWAERRRIEAHPKTGAAQLVEIREVERLYEAHTGPATIATREQFKALLAEAAAQPGVERFSPRFLLGEWQDVMDAWQLDTWEDYRDVRKFRQIHTIFWSEISFEDFRRFFLLLRVCAFLFDHLADIQLHGQTNALRFSLQPGFVTGVNVADGNR